MSNQISVPIVFNPGPVGPAGFTTLSAPFTIPAPGLSAVATVTSSQSLTISAYYTVADGTNLAVLQLTAIPSATQATLLNVPGFATNAKAGVTIQTGGLVIPSATPTMISTVWTDLLVDGATTLSGSTLLPTISVNEEVSIAAYVEVVSIGVSPVQGGSVTRYCQVINVGGTITNPLNNLTSSYDFDASRPPPPANLTGGLTTFTAQIVSVSGPSVGVSVTRPTGFNCRARATIAFTRLPRPVQAYLFTATPNVGVLNGGTVVTLAGDGLATCTGVTLDGIAATLGTITDLSVQVTATASPSSGVGNIVMTFSDRPTVTLVNGWTYQAAVIPIVTAVTPFYDRAEGGQSVVITGPVGANFTGATQVKLNGTNVASFVVNSDTQITATVAAGTAGRGDVTITSRTGNTNLAGNNLWLYMPLGFTFFRDSVDATGGASLSTWPSRIGDAWTLQKASSPPIHSNDTNGLQAVVSKSGTGYFAWTNVTTFTGNTATAIMIGNRPVAPGANTHLLSINNSSGAGTSPDTSQTGAMVCQETNAGGMNVFRNSVSAHTATQPAVSSTTFALSMRADNVNGVILRQDGVDLATVAQNGALSLQTIEPGQGWATGALFNGNPENELHVLWIGFASRNFVSADFAVMSSLESMLYNVNTGV